MIPYKKMYFHLFNKITDALRQMEKGNYMSAMQILMKAQQDGEDMYIGEETN